MKAVMFGRSVFAMTAIAALFLMTQAVPASAVNSYSYSVSPTPPISSPGVPVTVTGTHTGSGNVIGVLFVWHNPTNHIVHTAFGSESSCGTSCQDFSNTFSPTVAGDWKVAIWFFTAEGYNLVIVVIHVSFIVLSQYPIGSLAAVAIPGLTLIGYGWYRRAKSIRLP